MIAANQIIIIYYTINSTNCMGNSLNRLDQFLNLICNQLLWMWNFILFVAADFEMNLALILQFFTVLFLSELIVTAVGTVFFTSLFSRPKVQINFQPPETKQKPHIIIILADDLVCTNNSRGSIYRVRKKGRYN